VLVDGGAEGFGAGGRVCIFAGTALKKIVSAIRSRTEIPVNFMLDLVRTLSQKI
jgi:hypothetical protein